MSDLTLTTELEAVNTILGAVGESPISSLDDDTGSFVDAELARNLLRQELRRVQTIGWTFNTDLEVTLTPNNSGEILVPSNTLRFIRTDTSQEYVVRGNRLYDRTLHTYTFTSSVTCNLVTLLPFEECPEALRHYVTVCASRKFQDQYQGDESLHKFHQRDELLAWAALNNYEAEVAALNVLSGNLLVGRLKGGR